MTGGIESSVSDPFVQTGVLQLLMEAPVSLQMRSKDSERLSRKSAHNKQRDSLPVSAEEGGDRILKVTAAIDDLLLWLNDYG